LRAAALRCAGVIFAASAGPPFNPPSRPSATAAGFFFDFVAMPEASIKKEIQTRENLPVLYLLTKQSNPEFQGNCLHIFYKSMKYFSIDMSLEIAIK
jgi:hypothetical protein